MSASDPRQLPARERPAMTYSLKVLRPCGGIRLSTEFHCKSWKDEKALSQLFHRLAARHRVQLWHDGRCIDSVDILRAPLRAR